MCPLLLRPALLWLAISLCAVATSGCHSIRHDANPRHNPPPVMPVAPRELAKVVLPTYIIEPPDILAIDAVRVVPLAPYRVKSLDLLSINVLGTLPDAPIAGTYAVEPGGAIHLGPTYGGAISVAGLTIEEIDAKIKKRLKSVLKDPQVSVTLAELASKQQIAGQHLVTSDGTVMLGTYGSVSVVGMTLKQAKEAIEAHLSQFLEEPEISVDVFAFNSKNYYVVTQGAGLGDGVTRMPITGNETVLDAISQINGLESVSSKKIWIARPTNTPEGCQVLPVDWQAITERGNGYTNYQILPGDRVFVAEDRLVALDNYLGKVISPLERILGFTSLGANTVRSINTVNQQNGIGGGF